MCLFNTSLEEPLKPYKPALKFISINAIIFFTYWQKIWIAVFKDNILNCFDKSAENYHHIMVMDSLESPLVCF